MVGVLLGVRDGDGEEGVFVGVLLGVDDGVLVGVALGVEGVVVGVVLGVLGVDDGVSVVRRVGWLVVVLVVVRDGSVVGVVVGVPLVVGCGPMFTVGGVLSLVLCSMTPVVTAAATASRASAAIRIGLLDFGAGRAAAGATIGRVVPASAGVPIGAGTTGVVAARRSAAARTLVSSAAVGRSAGSLASIRSRRPSSGPASSGRSRLGGTGSASTCW